MRAFPLEFVVMIILLVVAVPLTVHAVRLAKQHRKLAYAGATLLLMFGIQMQVDPPPPPRIEGVERDEEEAKGDEPV